MPSYNTNGIKVKQPRFLIKDLVETRLHNGIWRWETYQSLFDDVKDEKAIGESTVLYLYYYEEAIQNIKKRLGDNVKIIIMLRNPVDRAYSAFQHVSRGFQEDNSFEKALDIEDGRMERNPSLTPMVMYKSMGLYFNQVKSYLSAFDDVHIIFYEDFRDQTAKEIKRTFTFLGIDEDININFDIKHNVGGRTWRNKRLQDLLMKRNTLQLLLKKMLPQKFRKEIREKLLNISMRKSDPMSEETRKNLNIFFKQDILNLSNLLNRDLTNWIK